MAGLVPPLAVERQVQSSPLSSSASGATPASGTGPPSMVPASVVVACTHAPIAHAAPGTQSSASVHPDVPISIRQLELQPSPSTMLPSSQPSSSSTSPSPQRGGERSVTHCGASPERSQNGASAVHPVSMPEVRSGLSSMHSTQAGEAGLPSQTPP